MFAPSPHREAHSTPLLHCVQVAFKPLLPYCHDDRVVKRAPNMPPARARTEDPFPAAMPLLRIEELPP